MQPHRTRWISLLVAGFVILSLRFALASPSPSRPLTDCTLVQCNFLPLITKYDPPTPTPTEIPTATPITPTIPPPPTATNTPQPVTPNCADPGSANAPNTPIQITAVNKAGNPETVTIRNKTAQTIDLTGWWICSLNGNQMHAVLSGTIAPNASLVIPSEAGGPIWNNTTTDPAALYDRYGTQISYRSQ